MSQKKMPRILLTGCLLLTAGTVFADYSSSQTNNPAYSSSQSQNVSNQSTVTSTTHHRQKHEGFSVHVDFPDFGGGIVLGEESYFVPGYDRPHHNAGFRWVNQSFNQPMPRRAVVGGHEHGTPLFVCHAKFRGGIHPGKVVDGRCNITYGGKELAFKHYQVLLGNRHLGWLSTGFGDYPPDAITGGYENGHPLKICQARFRGGMHPGKLVAGHCNIGYNGQEIERSNYNVLIA